jgi:hypothetical protein
MMSRNRIVVEGDIISLAPTYGELGFEDGEVVDPAVPGYDMKFWHAPIP